MPIRVNSRLQGSRPLWKRYLALGVLAAVAVVSAVTWLYVDYRTTPITRGGIPGIDARFNLSTSNGQAVSERTYHGKWLLVYFGFTACPDACPTALLSVGGALGALGPLARNVQPLFITIDPVRDTPMVMTRYLTSFDPRIVGLVGTPEQIAAAAKSYRAYTARRNIGPNATAIDHSSFMYVVDPQGKVAAILTDDLPGHALADELRALVH